MFTKGKAKVIRKAKLRTNDTSQSPRAPRPSASSSSLSDMESCSIDRRRDSKKRKSNQGDALISSCDICPEKDAKIEELSGHLQQLRLEIGQGTNVQQAKELEDMRSRYYEMKLKYEAECEAKDNALLRLSSMASSRLRDNNPYIADLSDQYRPTKLAEIFSQIYDNEWTDAYESLEKKSMKEKEIIAYLLEVVMCVYKKCKTIADEHLATLKKLVLSPFPAADDIDGRSDIKDIIKSIKDYRKSCALNTIQDVEKAIMSECVIEHMEIEDVKTYVDACIKISWLAVLQDPPVVLCIDQDPTSKFDSDRFQDYTKRGRFVDYVVWPAMLLCEGGSLLRKGVAQGADTAHNGE